MKLGAYDGFMIGICLAFSISLFIEKDFDGIIIQGFILGLYFGIKYAHNKFRKGQENEK